MASLVERRRARQSRSRPWKTGHSLPATPTNVDDDNASVVSTAVSFGSGTSTTLTESSLLNLALSKLAVVPASVVSPLKIRLKGKKPCGIPRPAARVVDGDDVEVIASYVDRRIHLAGLEHFLLTCHGKPLYPSRIGRCPVMVGPDNPFYRAVDWHQPPAVFDDMPVASEFDDVNDPTRVIASQVPKRSCLKKGCSRSVKTPKVVKRVRFGDQVDTLIGKPVVLVSADNPFYKAVDVYNLPSTLQPEQLPSRFPKVRNIEMIPKALAPGLFVCEHALAWERYLKVFYPRLISLRGTGSELFCEELACYSQEEKLKGIEDEHPSEYCTRSIELWAEDQADMGYNYFTHCVGDDGQMLYDWTEESGVFAADTHPAWSEINKTCACITGSGWWRHSKCMRDHKPFKGPVQTF